MQRRRFQLLRSPFDQYLPGVRGLVLTGIVACLAFVALPVFSWGEALLSTDAAALLDTEMETHPVVVRWAVRLLVVAMLAAASVSLWNLQMRRKVRQQTHVLREEVSRRERTERDLRAHQSMLANAQRVARMGSWERDLRTDRLVWSDESFRIFDFDPATFPGTYEAFVARIHPDDRPKRDAALARALQGDGLTSVEYRIRRADGTVRIIYERGEIIRDANGEPARKVGMVMDVTEQRASENASREKDALLRMAGNLGRIGGWAVDLPGRRVVWSDEACSIHEMPPGSAPSVEQVIQSYAPEYRNSVRHAFEACAVQGVSFDLEARLALPAGRRPWVRFMGEAGRDENGDIVRVKGALQDITDRKALEQQFLRAQRQESIGTLAGGIAHDLNNVLTPILMSIDLLRLNARDPDDLRILDTIGVSARRGADMVRQVLSFARGAPGTRVPTPVSQLIGDIERIIQDTFPKSIGCELRVREDVWPVLCDPTQIHQVLLNLCVNARDAMPDGGVLTLVAGNVELGERDTRFHGAGKIGRHVKLEVIDTGMGIPADLREKIFDPFFTTKEVGKGTGLGLSTVANLVRAHGGFIRVSSEVGHGSTFTLHLPAADPQAIQASASPGFALARGRGETVLIVDDEEAVRIITQQALEMLGYRVLEAENGADAVAIFVQRRDEIDLVLTDMMMPIMDGLTAIRTLLNIDPTLPIIAASGLNATINAAEAMDAGAKQFLAKPFTAETLLNAVRDTLASSELRRGS